MKQNSHETRPYAPSLLDRFIGFVERLPWPYWLTYLGLFILQSLILHALGWIFGWLSFFPFSSIILLFPLWQWGPLALMTHLNRVAQEALTSFHVVTPGNCIPCGESHRIVCSTDCLLINVRFK